MQEKAEQGIWPTKTPLGYLNVIGPDGRKVIAVDPEVASIITKLFEWYATGEYALKEIAKKVRAATMYVDKLDGKITGASFEEMSGKWREEQRRLQRDIERHEEAEQSYMEEGLRILELARNAQALFERQPAREKRRPVSFVLSNCTGEDGEVVATFRQPFDLFAETAAAAASAMAANQAKSAKNETWLGR